MRAAYLWKPYLTLNLWCGVPRDEDRGLAGHEAITIPLAGTPIELGGGVNATLHRDVSFYDDASYLQHIDGLHRCAAWGDVEWRSCQGSGH